MRLMHRHGLHASSEASAEQYAGCRHIIFLCCARHRPDVTSEDLHTVAAAVQAAALATLRLLVTSGAASAPSPPDVLLPRLLAACADRHSDVREAALSCLQAAEQAPEALVASELMTTSVLADLRQAVLKQQELIEGDPQGMLQVCAGSDVRQGGAGPCSIYATTGRDEQSHEACTHLCHLSLLASPACCPVHLLGSLCCLQMYSGSAQACRPLAVAAAQPANVLSGTF